MTEEKKLQTMTPRAKQEEVINPGRLQVKFPKAKEDEVVNIPSGQLGNIKQRLEDMNRILSAINLIVVLSLVAIIIAVIGLFLDQMRYNNAAYRDYSDKIKTLDSTLESNKNILEQNKKNQDLIIELQNQLKKK